MMPKNRQARQETSPIGKIPTLPSSVIHSIGELCCVVQTLSRMAAGPHPLLRQSPAHGITVNGMKKGLVSYNRASVPGGGR